MTNLKRRLQKLEGTAQERQVKMADLSKFTDEELVVLERVLDFAVAREVANPTGKRPLEADLSCLSAPEMAIYHRAAERMKCQ